MKLSTFLLLVLCFLSLCIEAKQTEQEIINKYNAKNWGVLWSNSADQLPGENLAISNWELSWLTPEISIPGPIPFTVSRKYTNIDSHYSVWTPNLIDRRWDLDIPTIVLGTWQNIYGQMSQCVGNRFNGPKDGGAVRTYSISMSSVGAFKEIGRSSGISYPVNTIAQYENNWLLICENYTTQSNSIDENGQSYPKYRTDGVTLLSPSGIKYRFSYNAAWKPFNWLPGENPNRKPILRNFKLYLSDIEDQFGNFVTIDYRKVNLNDGFQLLKPLAVRTKDGRKVSFQYYPSSNNNLNQSHQLKSLAYGNRIISYEYENNKLKRVKLPESLSWEFEYQSGANEFFRELSKVTTPMGATVEYTYDDLQDLSGRGCGSARHLNTSVSNRKVTVNGKVYQYTYEVDKPNPSTKTVKTRAKRPGSNGLLNYEEYTSLCNVHEEKAPLTTQLVEHTKGTFNSISKVYQPVRHTRQVWTSIEHGTKTDFGGWNKQSTHRAYTKKIIIDNQFVNETLSIDGFGNATSRIEKNGNNSRIINRSYWNSPSSWKVGFITAETIGNDAKSTYQYDAYGRMTQEIINGVLSKFGYSGAYLASVTNANNEVTRYSNYQYGLPRTISHPSGTRKKAYNVHGRLTASTNENNITTYFQWDGLGRLKGIDYPSGNDSIISYTGNSKVTTTKGNYVEEIYLDDLNRTLRRVEKDAASGEKRYQLFQYDNRGNILFQSLNSNNASETRGARYTYDVVNRVVSTSTPTGTTINDYSTPLTIKTTSPNGYKHIKKFEAYKHPDERYLIETINQLDTSGNEVRTSIQRDSVGRQTKVSQDGKSMSYSYHPTYKSFVASIKQPSHTEYYTPNNKGLVANKRYADGNNISYQYDHRNNVTQVNYSDSTPDASFSYTPNGLIRSASNSSGSWSYSYNMLGALTGETLVSGSRTFRFSYSYDSNLSLETIKYPTGLSLSLVPNAFGEPTQAGSFARQVKHHSDGRLAGYYHGNNVYNLYKLKSDGVGLHSISATYGRSKLFHQEYNYDRELNLTSLIDYKDSTRSISNIKYDGLSRLRSAHSTAFGGVVRYTYDATGNVNTYQRGRRPIWNYSYDKKNLLTSISSTNYKFSYDLRGNVTNNGKHSFVYNLANQMVSAGAKLYTYDAHGKRIKEGTKYSVYTLDGKLRYSESGTGEKTNHIYLGTRLIAEHNATSKNTDYVHTDFLGSPTLRTGSYGSVKMRTHYEAFGKSDSAKSGVGYTGHKFDGDNGLSYMQARYYDPAIGRFYSSDPVGFRDVYSFNRYVYANNNPYKFVDPDGERAKRGEAFAILSVTIAEAAGWMEPEMAQNIRDGISGKVRKRSNFRKNQEKGRQHEKKTVQKLSETRTDVKEQITVKTESGTKTRLDVVSKDSSGNTKCTECKSGSAGLTTNQAKAFPEIEKSGATVVGQGKPPYTGGTKIPPTKVEIVRDE